MLTLFACIIFFFFYYVGIPIHHDYKTASNQTINFLAPLLSDTVSTQVG